MPGLLTGDYEALLQVSEATVDRLLASMHQNAGSNPDTPTFPHSIGLRVGDSDMIDGVRGTAWGQIGVPRIHLIDGATDRFWLEVGVRLRYRADPDTAPLPEFITGTVRAQYALEDIDPSCPGWRHLAADYLWVRVVEDTVSFEGDAYDDDALLVARPPDAAVVNATITRQIVGLLDSTYAATPHRVTKRFRRGSFVSLVQANGVISVPLFPAADMPIGGAAVVLPVGITGDPPAGALGSVQNVVLAGRDFAVAVGQDVVMELVEPALADIRNYTTSISFTVTGYFLGEEVYEDTFVYHASISSANAVWVPHGSYATIEVDVAGGAHTSSALPDFTFTVKQRFQVDFDAGAEQLRLWAAGNTCQMHASGLGLPGDMLHNLAVEVGKQVEAMAEAAAASAQPSLQTFGNGRVDLVGQLQTLDAHADAHFDEASFYLEGVVLRGWISVSGRHRPHVEFHKIDDDTFSALQSWIPGGRIDEHEWSWSWSGNAQPSAHETNSGSFVLRRPRESTTKFGMVVGHKPLPGLDGGGRMCLTIRGVRVDTATGALVAVESQHACTRYGFGDLLQVGIGRLLLPDVPQLVQPPDRPHPPEPPERGFADVAHRAPAGSGANTLIVLAPRGLAEPDAATLRGALSHCRRDDAGLLIVLLLAEGEAERADATVRERLRGLAEALEAPLLVSEDVNGSWATMLGAPDAADDTVAWRLVSPDGGLVWMHDGRIEAQELAAMLDAGLMAGTPASPRQFEPTVERGLLSPSQIGALFEHPHHERAHCPPLRLLRDPGAVVRTVVSTVSFATGATSRSADDVRQLVPERRTQGGGSPVAVIVLDGASADDAAALTDELGPAYLVLADSDGSIADSFGVRRWPTTIPIGDAVSGPSYTISNQEVTA